MGRHNAMLIAGTANFADAIVNNNKKNK